MEDAKKQESETSLKSRCLLGKSCQIFTNYTKIDFMADTKIYVHEVSFSPAIESRLEREKNLEENVDTVGYIWTFNCQTIFLPYMINDTSTTLVNTSSNVLTKIAYKGNCLIGESKEFWQALVYTITRELGYKKIYANYYNPSKIVAFYDDDMEMWSGFNASIGEHEDGLMLCLNYDGLVLDKLTVFERMKSIPREDIKKQLIGRDFMVKAVNMTYRIEDVSFCEHYNESDAEPAKYVLLYRHNETSDTFFIAPENCFLVGLDDRMPNYTDLMMQERSRQQLDPRELFECIENFIQQANQNANIKTVLQDWDLKLATKQIILTGRMLGDETIHFGKDKTINAGPSAHFSRENRQVLDAVNIRNWLLIYCKDDSKEADFFLQQYLETTKSIGIHVNPAPVIEVLDKDDAESYLDALKKHQEKWKFQFVVAIFPSDTPERYIELKKVLCSEIPVPSQVLNAKALKNSAKIKGLILKITHQINSKLNGALWKVKIPMEDFMVCGIHTSSIPEGDPVYALVASNNSTVTKWFSKAIVLNTAAKLENALSLTLQPALKEYKAKNGQFPGRLIMFRDGEDGIDQLQAMQNDELEQIMKTCQQLDSDYKPEVTYIFMKKAAITKLMVEWSDNKANPRPGCVVNHTIVRSHQIHEYFLLSQNVMRGTGSPTNYVVVHNTGYLDFDILESLTYKLCFLNFQHLGSFRIPACCYYAQKLTSFVATKIQIEPSDMLCDKLFYL